MIVKHVKYDFNNTGMAIVDWKTNKVICITGLSQGMEIANRSKRFDNNHCTEAVRRLADQDCHCFPGDADPFKDHPVYFIVVEEAGRNGVIQALDNILKG